MGLIFIIFTFTVLPPIGVDGTDIRQFYCHTGNVFDTLNFSSKEDAITALRRNGFSLNADELEMQLFLHPPKPPFYPGSHPKGPIYSSGRFWK